MDKSTRKEVGLHTQYHYDIETPPPASKWYGQHRRPWKTLSPAIKVKWKCVQLIEESNAGENNPYGSCAHCQARGYVCKTFTAAFREQHKMTAKCSRCRSTGYSCYSSPHPTEQVAEIPIQPTLPVKQPELEYPSTLVQRLQAENQALDDENEKLTRELSQAEAEIAGLNAKFEEVVSSQAHAQIINTKLRQRVENIRSELKLMRDRTAEHTLLGRGMLKTIEGWQTAYEALACFSNNYILSDDRVPTAVLYVMTRHQSSCARFGDTSNKIVKRTKRCLRSNDRARK